MGPINTTNNAMIKSSIDGTCAGSDAGVATVVQAANYDAARDMCETVGNTLSVQRLFDIGYKSVPFDHYICAPP